MKNNELKDIKSKSKQDLQKKLVEIKNELDKLVKEKISGKLKSISIIGNKKKEIAQIKAIQKEKEISEL